MSLLFKLIWRLASLLSDAGVFFGDTLGLSDISNIDFLRPQHLAGLFTQVLVGVDAGRENIVVLRILSERFGLVHDQIVV